MSNNFLGEFRVFPYNSVPRGWLPCNGQILPITSYQALYTLLGNIYGGDGKTSFALPDLRGRVLLGAGVAPPLSYARGQAGGAEAVALTIDQIPPHTHQWNASGSTVNGPSPNGNYLGVTGPAAGNLYDPNTTPNQATVTLNAATVGSGGAGQAHNNMQPFLPLVYCIAKTGLWPSRN